MKRSDLEAIFNQFNQLNVLVLGDVMIDAYLWGDVNRISPEAPVQVLSNTKREIRLGGAANVALNIQALGANPILCSVVGDDLSGKQLIELLNESDMDKTGIVHSPDRLTTKKTRIISQNHHLLRVDEEMSHPILPKEEASLIDRVKSILDYEKIDALIFEDYDKGVITQKVIDEVVNMANQKGIVTLVDPKKRNFSAYHNVTLFKPNFKEFKEGVKEDIEKGNKEELLKFGQEFKNRLSLDVLMITLSEHGVFVCDKDSHSFIPAEIRNIADVSGAGDTVISVSALCLAQKLSANIVAQIGNLAGGLVCEESGVVPIDKALLLEECIEKMVNDN